MPRYSYPEPTLQELLEKIEELENLVVIGKVSEWKKRKTNTLMLESKTNTTLVAIRAVTKPGELVNYVVRIGGSAEANDYQQAFLKTPAVKNEVIYPFLIVVPAGIEWE